MPWPFPDPRIVAPPAATPKLPLGIGRPPMPVAGPQHLAARDSGFLGRLMPTPRGMGGLLTDEDLRHARAQGLLGFGLGLLDYNTPSTDPKSFGQGLARAYGAGQQAFQGSAQGAAQGAMYEQQQAQQAKAQQLREQVGQILQNPRMTPPQRQQALMQMMAAAFQAGDTEAMGPISQALMALRDEQPAARNPQEIRLGNEVILRDPATGEVLDRYPVGAPPRDPNSPVEAQRQFQRENTLATSYERAVKAPMEAYEFVSGALANAPLAMAGDGAAQVEMLYAFIKAMDPATAVREGELELARLAAPFWSWAMGNAEKVANKSMVVPAKMIEQMRDLMQKRVDGYSTKINRTRDQYLQRARRADIDDPEVLFLGVPSASGVSAPSAGRKRPNPLLVPPTP